MGWNYTNKDDFPGELPDWLIALRKYQAGSMKVLRDKRLGEVNAALVAFMDDQSDLLAGEEYIAVLALWLKHGDAEFGDNADLMMRGRGGRWLAKQLPRFGLTLTGPKGKRMVAAVEPDPI